MNANNDVAYHGVGDLRKRNTPPYDVLLAGARIKPCSMDFCYVRRPDPPVAGGFAWMSLSGMLVCLFLEYSAAKMSGHPPATPDSILANNLVPCRPLAPQNKYILPQLGLFC